LSFQAGVKPFLYKMKNQQLDITNEHCPMTFVKTKLALEQLDAGARLEVLLVEGEPLENVPKSATQQGYRVLEIKNISEKIYKITIEK